MVGVRRSAGHTETLPVLALGALTALASLSLAGCPAAAQQQQKPNIVVIWGDDIGQSNVSAYSRGMMGYKTPNIDRVASEGIMFTDFYAEQSCTAGRASFITGQSGLRTGMTKVGLPGATLGLQKEDPTIAELLKPLGYATGQFGKNQQEDELPIVIPQTDQLLVVVGTASAGNVVGLGKSVHELAGSENIQPPNGSIRASGYHLK